MIVNNKLEKVVSLLKENKKLLREKYKIKEIGIFGSYVRGEEESDSDIDILIDKEETIGLLKLANLQNYLSRLLGIPVDLVIKKKIHPHISENISNEVIYV